MGTSSSIHKSRSRASSSSECMVSPAASAAVDKVSASPSSQNTTGNEDKPSDRTSELREDPSRQQVDNTEVRGIAGSKGANASERVPPGDNGLSSKMEDEVSPKQGPERSGSMEPKDIMISYSHLDRDKMHKMRDALENAGISVWVDETGLKAGVEFLNKIGQAIIDAKLFLSLLSTKSASSKYCKDELALAYVSSKPIFPCIIEPQKDVNEVMDFGMRLQLAPIRMFDFVDDETFQKSFLDLAMAIQAKLKDLADSQIEKKDGAEGHKKHKVLERRETRSRLNTHLVKKEEKASDDFWEKNFKDETKVPAERFIEAFQADSTDELTKLGITMDWIVPVLKQELDEENDDFITKESYEHFCIIDDERKDFWVRLREQALERYTMLEVFSMDSTVRLDAIQNLAKFHSRSVVEAMMDLCTDRDDNVRAVAAISLARVAPSENRRVVRRLLRLLRDRDRLVRQSGCLALGHMKAKQAVPLLLQLWRNDAISNVREAAHVALENIGGEEAQEAIHITKVLSAEIKALGQAK